MPAVIFTMLIVLGVAAGIIAVVVMGMEGTGRSRHPEIADAMARTARHLNGEGRPPKGLTLLFDEIDGVSASDFDPRQIPGRLKSSLAAVSARSAASARSATSAPELDLTTVAPAPVMSETQAADGAGAPPEDVNPWAAPESAPTPEAREVDLARALDTPASEVVFDDPYGVAAADVVDESADVWASDDHFDDPYGVFGTSASHIDALSGHVSEPTAREGEASDAESAGRIRETNDPLMGDTVAHRSLPLDQSSH